ncbi:hypothetical protein [Sulfurimonas sp.]|uniref:hypothetical protein n=1 Tax=Sulfurimonas sp. TaxID=2022749 RepID=UPI002B46A115|nr:hypothetical protein [Sulfurimonas sp.]
MARKNKLIATKFRGVKEIVNLHGGKEFIVSFSYKGFRINEKNFTKLFNCKTAKQAHERIPIVKDQIDKGEDPLTTTTNKIGELVLNNLEDKNIGFKKNSTHTYNKHIKPIIGHKYIERVTEKDLIKIRTNMEKQGLALSTIKKIRTILSPIFKKAHNKGIIKVNVLLEVPMGGHETKPRLEERLHGTIKDNAQNIFNKILVLKEFQNDEEFKSIFLISMMCARRLGEILEITYEDIIDGVVHVRGSTTKTYKIKGERVVERYPLPKEVLKIIGKGKGKVFNHQVRSCLDEYKKMIENECNLEVKELGKKFPIRGHDNRHFIMSLCSEKFGKDNVGSLALSHNSVSNMNDVYLSTEYKRVEELFKYYWRLLRSKPKEL